MPHGGALNCDSRFSLVFLNPAKSLSSRRTTIQFPQPLAGIHRNRQRPPSNGFVESAPERRAHAHFLLECAPPTLAFIRLDTLFDTRILHSIRNLQLSLLREGLCAAVSLRFDGLSGEELRVNV